MVSVLSLLLACTTFCEMKFYVVFFQGAVTELPVRPNSLLCLREKKLSQSRHRRRHWGALGVWPSIVLVRECRGVSTALTPERYCGFSASHFAAAGDLSSPRTSNSINKSRHPLRSKSGEKATFHP